MEVFLNIQNIDVCLISETHLTRHTIIKCKGFKTYHTPHPDNQARGGSAILIKESIVHYEQQPIQQDKMQLTHISVVSMKQLLNIGAVYCPPRHNLNDDDFVELLNHLGERFILGGDYNAKHVSFGCRLTTTKGRNLKKAITRTGCTYYSSGKPTYWPTDIKKTPDLLDFFIVKKVSCNFIKVSDSYDLHSDHSAVILLLSETIRKREPPLWITNKTTDWNSFKSELERDIKLNIELKTTVQLDDEVHRFTTLIQSCLFRNTDYTCLSKAGAKYPSEIRTLVKEKRNARKKWQHTRAPGDKTILNNLSQRLKRKIKMLKNDSFNTYLQSLSPDKRSGYSLWKATKNLKRPVLLNPPIRDGDGSWARDNMQKADVFAEYLANTFTPHVSIEEEILPDITPSSWSITLDPVTSKEITDEIKTSFSTKKSPGFDLLTGEVLQKIPRKGIIILTHIFNAALRLKHVPDSWKVAEVIMILKPGKPPNDVKSYRPISLLPIISKLFEKLLLKRLKPVLESHGLIPDYQFGFRSSHSTLDQVHRITHVIEKSLEGKKVCGAVFLDVAQAFDKVWHDGLIHKLHKLLPKEFAQILTDYISNRLFRIKHEDAFSSLREIQAGVPQGSVLGPVLYLLYTCDIPNLEGVTIATFADDTALLAVDDSETIACNKLQKACNTLVKWTKQWKIKLHEQKSIHINFTNKRILNPSRLYINGVVVPYENTAKYLGMTLDTKLRWKEHVKKKKTELDLKFSNYQWLLGKQSQLAIHNKILIYNQILKPVWLYGCQLWGCTKDSNIHTIQTFQNKVLRHAVNAPWYIRNSDLHRDLNVSLVKDEIHRFAAKHQYRLENHVNPSVAPLLNNEHLERRLRRTKPFELVR